MESETRVVSDFVGFMQRVYLTRYDLVHIPTTLKYIKNFRTKYAADSYLEGLGDDRVYMQALGSQYLRDIPPYFSSYYLYTKEIPDITTVFSHEFFVKSVNYCITVSLEEMKQFKDVGLLEVIEGTYDRG